MGPDKKLLIAGAALAGTVAMVPAVAHAGSVDCDSNRVCIYDGNNFVGIIGERAPGNGLANIRSRYNDKMDSWENKTNSDSAWYHDIIGNGNCNDMDSQNQDTNINFIDSDELSSWRTNGECNDFD